MEASYHSAHFPLLKNPQNYRPCTIDYQYGERRQGSKALSTEKVWLDVFRRSIPSFRARAANDETVSNASVKADKFADRYGKMLDDLEEDCERHGGPPDCLLLCRLRDLCLRELGFDDIFKSVKETENKNALAILPSVVKKVDAVEDDGERCEHLVKGILAGNIFDLGASETTELFENGDMSFHKTFDKLLPRPWAIDDLDDFKKRWVEGPPYNKAVIFVDNAGADVVLGILPFARELLRRGTKVVLAANDVASINDITYHELIDMLEKMEAKKEEELLLHGVDSGRLTCVNSGNDAPVIDLSAISPELAWASEGADLVVLEGMGRSIETNLNAEFKVDSLNIGMVKHPEVAEFLKARMFDCVVKFTRAS
eukprot:TRINITY_DN7690_c0_g1_i1.p1 TRINITY_DN7690_c0_g1~~TRINITY_DN7690_c0_g1_i1.p1  ORF type:complete len:370 (+),score=97.00 TRINITY_DN7690_c0_g1_i1:49-1158(+)